MTDVHALCFASHPDPTGWHGRWFFEREVNCTELAGHAGDHVARAPNGAVLARWKNVDELWHGAIQKLDTIIALLKEGKTMNAQVQAALETLAAKVAAETTVVTSAVALLGGVQAAIAQVAQDAVDNPAIAQRLTDLADGIGTSTDALAAAVATGTTQPPPTV